MRTKAMRIADDVREILAASEVVPEGNGGFVLQLAPGQLERTLYVRVNKVLEAMGGAWSRTLQGNVFSHDPRPARHGAVVDAKIIVAKEGWFPTPSAVVARMLDLGGEIESHGILEPSAGEGAIVDAVCHRHPDIKRSIWCVERDPDRAAVLVGKGYRTIVHDFLTLQPGFSGWATFSHIYMNPPFEDRQDINHVLHAFDFLEPGGILVAIMSEGTFYRQDRATQAFSRWLDALEASSLPLAKDSFAGSGAHVSTRLGRLQKARAAVPMPRLGLSKQLGLFEEA